MYQTYHQPNLALACINVATLIIAKSTIILLRNPPSLLLLLLLINKLYNTKSGNRNTETHKLRAATTLGSCGYEGLHCQQVNTYR